MFKHILAPIDGSDCSLWALEAAAHFAAEQHARLTVCTVIDLGKAAALAFGDPATMQAAMDALNASSKALVDDATARIAPIAGDAIVLQGPTVDTIVDYATSHAVDLIVIGSHGRSGVPRFFLGSVAEGVIRHAHMPVLVVRQGVLAATSAAAER